jgi:hypothetical protein
MKSVSVEVEVEGAHWTGALLDSPAASCVSIPDEKNQYERPETHHESQSPCPTRHSETRPSESYPSSPSLIHSLPSDKEPNLKTAIVLDRHTRNCPHERLLVHSLPLLRLRLQPQLYRPPSAREV